MEIGKKLNQEETSQTNFQHQLDNKQSDIVVPSQEKEQNQTLKTDFSDSNSTKNSFSKKQKYLKTALNSNSYEFQSPYLQNVQHFNSKIQKLSQIQKKFISGVHSQRVHLRQIRNIIQNQNIPTYIYLNNQQKLLFGNGKLEVHKSSLYDFLKSNLDNQGVVQDGSGTQLMYTLKKRKRRTYKKDF